MTAPAWPGETREQMLCLEGVRLQELWAEAVCTLTTTYCDEHSDYVILQGYVNAAALAWFTHKNGTRKHGMQVQPKCETCNTYRRLPK